MEDFVIKSYKIKKNKKVPKNLRKFQKILDEEEP